jgi:hypothetical protein
VLPADDFVVLIYGSRMIVIRIVFDELCAVAEAFGGQ